MTMAGWPIYVIECNNRPPLISMSIRQEKVSIPSPLYLELEDASDLAGGEVELHGVVHLDQGVGVPGSRKERPCSQKTKGRTSKQSIPCTIHSLRYLMVRPSWVTAYGMAAAWPVWNGLRPIEAFLPTPTLTMRHSLYCKKKRNAANSQ